MGSIRISNHTSFHFTEPRSNWNFPRKNSYHAPSSFLFHLTTTSLFGLPIRGPSGNFQPKPHYIAQVMSISTFSQETSMPCKDHIPNYRPINIPSCSPSHTPFQYSIPTHHLPQTHPTIHINLPPSLFPLAPPLLNLTYGLYQAALGHTGHTVLVFKDVSYSQVQSRMKSCIQLCTRVKKKL